MHPSVETTIILSAITLAVGAVVMSGGAGLGWFAAVPCLVFGAALVYWHRSPDASTSAVVLLTAGFVRLLLGPIGLGALLLVPVLARQADPEHARHLAGAAIGTHLAIFLANQLAVVIGEPFPTLTTFSPGEAIVGVALFLPFMVLDIRDDVSR